LGRDLAYRDNDSRFDGTQLVVQVPSAGGLLILLWVPVLGRTALHGVRDEHVFRREAGLREQPVQDLACVADERMAFLVLLLARGLSYQHDVGSIVASAGDGLRPCQGETTQLAVSDEVRDGVKLGLHGVCLLRFLLVGIGVGLLHS
jgi:hypothetical protein